jgi:hypothetical protein
MGERHVAKILQEAKGASPKISQKAKRRVAKISQKAKRRVAKISQKARGQNIANGERHVAKISSK